MSGDTVRDAGRACCRKARHGKEQRRLRQTRRLANQCMRVCVEKCPLISSHTQRRKLREGEVSHGPHDARSQPRSGPRQKADHEWHDGVTSPGNHGPGSNNLHAQRAEERSGAGRSSQQTTRSTRSSVRRSTGGSARGRADAQGLNTRDDMSGACERRRRRADSSKRRRPARSPQERNLKSQLQARRTDPTAGTSTCRRT